MSSINRIKARGEPRVARVGTDNRVETRSGIILAEDKAEKD
jgi:hypothetical protein